MRVAAHSRSPREAPRPHVGLTRAARPGSPTSRQTSLEEVDPLGRPSLPPSSRDRALHPAGSLEQGATNGGHLGLSCPNALFILLPALSISQADRTESKSKKHLLILLSLAMASRGGWQVCSSSILFWCVKLSVVWFDGFAPAQSHTPLATPLVSQPL